MILLRSYIFSNSRYLFFPSLFLFRIDFLGMIPGSVKVVKNRKKHVDKKE